MSEALAVRAGAVIAVVTFAVAMYVLARASEDTIIECDNHHLGEYEVPLTNREYKLLTTGGGRRSLQVKKVAECQDVGCDETIEVFQEVRAWSNEARLPKILKRDP